MIIHKYKSASLNDKRLRFNEAIQYIENIENLCFQDKTHTFDSLHCFTAIALILKGYGDTKELADYIIEQPRLKGGRLNENSTKNRHKIILY